MQSEPELLLNLARQELGAGQLESAESKLQQVLQVRPLHPVALNLLGQVLSTQGRHSEAVQAFESLTQAQPEVAGNWANLGTALRFARRHDDALTAFERALKLGTPNAGLLFNLGMLQMDRCDHQAAYLALRDAWRMAPREAAICWAFAQCCFELSLLEESLAALDGWQSFERLSVDLTVRIILLLVAMGASSRASPVLERMRQVPPAQGRVGVMFASILERLNQLSEARAVLERSVLADPTLETDSEQLLIAAVLAERAGDHASAYEKSSLALKFNVGAVRPHTLLFAKAKACDALGRHEEAFSTAREAHEDQRQFIQSATGMSSPEQSQTWKLTSTLPDPEDVASWSEQGPDIEESPIFVVGFPRSGTTLIEQVLDGHPALQSIDEQPILMRTLDELSRHGGAYPTQLGRLSPVALDELRRSYWDRSRSRGWLPGRRLVDKNPLNMILVPLIKRLFPRAPIVLVLRHPCDALFSCYLQNFRAAGLAMLCRDLSTLAHGYDRVFDYWVRCRELLQPAVLELKYENVVADLSVAIRELTEFLDLVPHEAMGHPSRTALAKGFISTPSYTQVVAPVTSRPVGRWKQYEPQFEQVLPVLRPWIERWGYSI